MIEETIITQIKPGARVRVRDEQGAFEGLVLARKHGTQAGGTFTVRAIVKGVGVEKVFPIHSPAITKIEILGTSKKVRRAKLYFIRGISGKNIRKKLGISL